MSPPGGPPLPAFAGEPRWWLEAAGKVWGPYPRDRLAGFVGEGRLSASSLVGRAACGPFSPAALDAELAGVFLPEARERLDPASPGVEDEAAAASRPRSRPLLVFAALHATPADLFEAALAAQGQSVRVAPGLWVLRASCAAAPLRNQLSRGLREGEVLWVSELDAAHAAWFALPGDTDRAVRHLLADRGD